MTVKVLKGFEGFSHGVEIVETIERQPIRRGGRRNGSNGRYFENRYNVVSYKGKLRKVFYLPESYGKIAGACITMAERF